MAKILIHYPDASANVVRQTENMWGGVGYYRSVMPSKMIKGHEVSLVGMELTKKGETKEERWARVFEGCDVFWTSYFSDPMEASALFYTRDKMGKKVILDCDDNFFDIVPSHPLYDKIKPTKRDRAFMATILSLADVITVSTEPLRQKLHEHFKKVHNLDKKIVIIPNMNHLPDWDFPLAEKNPDKFVIGYAGSNSHQDDLEMFFPALKRIMEKYPHVFFESVGSISKNMLGMFKDFDLDTMLRCDLLPSTWTFREYPEMMCNTKWDIGVAPLVDSPFTRCKSHIKFLEYSAIKLPIIASKVYPYYVEIDGREVITHEKTGLLVKPSEWFDAMEDLILNKEKRIQLGLNAYEHVKQNWQYEGSDIGQKISDIISELYTA